jgi:hypothetical protein
MAVWRIMLEMLEHTEALLRFDVGALDGAVGVVIDADQESLLVCRRRLFRTTVIIPARAIGRIDMRDRAIELNRTRREVGHIPQPKGSGRKAWFVPASNRLSAGNPVIGGEPRRGEPSA